jgi:hypothetical protein
VTDETQIEVFMMWSHGWTTVAVKELLLVEEMVEASCKTAAAVIETLLVEEMVEL